MNESLFTNRLRVFAPALLLVSACGASEPQPQAALQCETPAVTGHIPAPLDEASGIALSERYPGVIWMVDDKGANVLHALDSTGHALGSVKVTGAKNTNWEDLGIARCGANTCLYIADIGDNLRNREAITIYRVKEPAPSDTAITPDRTFTLRYPERPHDAEALIVLPDEQLYIVTKGRSEPITVYRAPSLTGDTLVLEPVQKLSQSFVQLPDLVTGGSATLDGGRIALRTYSSVQVYSLSGDTLAPLLAGKGADLSGLQEPQGEGVAIRGDGVLFFNSEQGLFAEGRPPISRMRCAINN